MSHSREEQFRSALLEWAEGNLRDFAWRDTDRSLYEVFVAEFFLTQTPAENVAEVYPRFLELFPSLNDLEVTEPNRIEDVIEPLGFQRMRTEALNTIADQYDVLPRARDDLLSLPRVGPYVADATLCFGMDEPLAILDRNVVRVYDRIFAAEFPDDEAGRRQFADSLLPDDGRLARRYNLGLLDFGAVLCTKRSPKCERCFASSYCEYFQDEGRERGERSTDSSF